MRILVCFKTVSEFELMTEDDWKVDECLRPDVRYVKKVLNPEDESALELALRLRDHLSVLSDVNLTALTVGEADRFGATLLALGFDSVVTIEASFDTRFDPQTVAKIIAQYSNNNRPDLILTGSRSADGYNNLTPYFLAQNLQWPIISEVTDIAGAAVTGSEVTGDDAKSLNLLWVSSLSDEGNLKQKVKLPLILAIGNAPTAYLRVPTLSDRLNAGKKAAVKIASKDFSANNLKLLRLNRELESRSATLVTQKTPKEIASLILSALGRAPK
jgi:electron transfer flavoprotein alpha/beta subunit